NATRRRRRSMAIAAMLACGSFLVAAVGINRLEAGRDATKRSAGTGGFALIGETSLPVVHDLNVAAGREFFTLDEKKLADVSVVPFRVRDGDEASCLNLNRAQKPRLLGVNPQPLAERAAFTFASLAKDAIATNGWLMLKRNAVPNPDEVAAIGDAASIQWALGKKVGDTMDYTDERGHAFKLRIVGAVANSILQGSLIIDEAEFVKRFPSETGYRFFLVDAPPADAANVAATLTRGLRDVGLELTPTSVRLAAFNAVQNTYLSTFQVLGGLGLLLGSVGLAVVVLRNVLERRGELALLLAVGFRGRAVKWLVVSEHGALLLLGLLSGILAALVAVLPGLLAPGAERHYTPLVATLAAVLVSGAAWTWIATALALRGPLLKALRNE
ncbi:MAG TPA: FtsX-like permease family protein, partial [Verrucomicrobiae bacterium]